MQAGPAHAAPTAPPAAATPPATVLLADPASDAWIPDLVAAAQAGRRAVMVYDGES